MNAKTTRILKEARALFWPWCAVMIAGALPLVPGIPHWIHAQAISALGFLAGMPLLATLSFGNEFQHRTLSLLLSQPAGRMEIWREKLVVTAAAVVSAAVVFLYAGRSMLRQEQWVVAGLYVIATTASATFWTLLARSTIGGFVLDHIPISGFELVGFTLNTFLPGFVQRLLEGNLPSRDTVAALSILSIVALGYAGLMLWLGTRKLARFQVTGGLPGNDLLMAAPNVVPEALARWFRYRPAQPFFNLILKELRLLRTLWPIALLVVLYMTCLTVFRLFPDFARMKSNFTGWVLVLSPLMGIPLMAILAGCLSLGEERTSGTHSWHLTLPVTVRRQWLIKLLVAVFMSLVCAVLLPVLVLFAGGNLSVGGPVWFVDPRFAVEWTITMPLLTLVSFWCGCAVKGTVRAVLWLFPTMGALLLAGRCGEWVAWELAPFAAGQMHAVVSSVVSRFDPLADFRFVYAVSSIHWYPRPLVFGSDTPLWLAPSLLFAVIQSYRMFRTELRDRTLSVIRNLLPLAIVAFLYLFSLVAFYAFVYHAREQMGTLFRETLEAIETIQSRTAKLDATQPLQLTVEDLAKASPLSPRTRRWLRNSTITVNPAEAHPDRYGLGRIVWGASFATGGTYSRYLATIHLASGSECTLAFEAGGGFGILGGVCE